MDGKSSAGITVHLTETDARMLVDVRRKLGSPTLRGALRVLIRDAFHRSEPAAGAEERPLVSLGQGEYRRNIMPGDC